MIGQQHAQFFRHVQIVRPERQIPLQVFYLRLQGLCLFLGFFLLFCILQILLGDVGLIEEEIGVAILLYVVNEKHARAAHDNDNEQNYRQPHI